MRKFLFIVVFAQILVACNNDTSKQTETGNNAEINLSDTCLCNELQIDSTGLHLKENKNYTGICLSYYEGSTNLYLQKSIMNGKLHGKVSYFDKEGNVLIEEMYENGKQKRTGGSDESITCQCDELEISKMNGYSVYKLDQVPFTGTCQKNYENSAQIYMECNYKNGLLHGYTQYFDKEGSSILLEKYEHGELISTIH